MTKSSKVIVCLLILFVIVAVFIINSTNKTKSSNAISSIKHTNKTASSIGEQWVKQDHQFTKDMSIENKNSSSLFTEESVYNALQAVKIDHYGDIILNNDALFALDEALERIHTNLDNKSLKELIDLINKSIPGKAGEQTAQLVQNYYNFLGAQAEFNALHQFTNTGPQTQASLDIDRSLYSDLQSLREVHLGQSASESLFQQSDANAQFMFDMLSLDLDTSLTPEQRDNRRAEIQAVFNEQSKSH